MNQTLTTSTLTYEQAYPELRTRAADVLFIACLFAPPVARLLLPSSYEFLLTRNLGPLPVFIPELLWFICPFLYRGSSRVFGGYKPIVGLAVVSLLCAFVGVMTGLAATLYPIDAIFASLELFLIAALLGFLPLQPWHEKPLLIGLTVLIALLFLQVTLFSFGIVSYKIDISDQEYEGISRISTTVAAATGTSHIVFLAGLWHLELAMRRKAYALAICVLMLTTITIGLLVSRGPMAMIALAGMLWVLRLLIAHSASFKQKTRAVLVASALAVVMAGAAWQVGVADAFMARIDTLQKGGDTMNRTGFVDTREDIADRPLAGHGASNYLVRKRFINHRSDRIAARSPHNTYLHLAVENGIPVAAVFLGLLSIYTVYLWWKLPFSIGASGLLAVMLLGLNIEMVYIEYEWFMFLLGMMCWLLLILRRAPQ